MLPLLPLYWLRVASLTGKVDSRHHMRMDVSTTPYIPRRRDYCTRASSLWPSYFDYFIAPDAQISLWIISLPYSRWNTYMIQWRCGLIYGIIMISTTFIASFAGLQVFQDFVISRSSVMTIRLPFPLIFTFVLSYFPYSRSFLIVFHTGSIFISQFSFVRSLSSWYSWLVCSVSGAWGILTMPFVDLSFSCHYASSRLECRRRRWHLRLSHFPAFIECGFHLL